MLNILILFTSLFCQTSPVSISSKSTLVDYSGERYFQLMFTVKSLSKEAFKYSLKIDFPKELELIEGSSSYNGDFKGLGEKKISIILNPLKETTGIIKLTFNFYKGEETSTLYSSKNFSTNYSVTKNTDAKLVFIATELAQTNNNIKKNIEPTIEEAVDNDANKTTAVVDKQFRVAKRSYSLELFRYFLFLLSLFILGFFIYKVRKN